MFIHFSQDLCFLILKGAASPQIIPTTTDEFNEDLKGPVSERSVSRASLKSEEPLSKVHRTVTT